MMHDDGCTINSGRCTCPDPAPASPPPDAREEARKSEAEYDKAENIALRIDPGCYLGAAVPLILAYGREREIAALQDLETRYWAQTGAVQQTLQTMLAHEIFVRRSK